MHGEIKLLNMALSWHLSAFCFKLAVQPVFSYIIFMQSFITCAQVDV